jgi:hypothetical protein
MISKLDHHDAEELLNFFKKLVTADPERVERPEDVKKISLESEEEWVKKLLQKERDGDIVVFVGRKDGSIVIEAEVEKKSRWIERHVGEIRFGMLPGNEELAKEIITMLIQEARKINIETLIYFHLATQISGLALIKDAGFSECGRIAKYYKRGNEYIDRIYLSMTIQIRK